MPFLASTNRISWLWFPVSLLSLPTLALGVVWWHNRTRPVRAIVVGTARWAVARLRWKRACEVAELTDGPRKPRLGVPTIADDRGNALQFRLNLQRIGLVVNDLEGSKDYLVSALGARRSRIYRVMPGVANLTIEWERNLSRSSVANPKNDINSSQLPRVELDQDVLIELDTSILVVGESGSGKSNLSWFILNEFNRNAIPYRLFVVDPKKVELAELLDSPNTRAYADDSRSADEVIAKFHQSMMDTFEAMKATKTRRVLITEANPLNVLLIDEVLLCKAFREGLDGPLGEILSAGRAAGYIVVANSQLGQVDAISRLRDLFPQRICLAVKSSDLVSAVLGPSAEARGARCTEITQKGVGYIYTDHSGSFQRFHPPFISDIAAVARGEYWDPYAIATRKKGKTL